MNWEAGSTPVTVPPSVITAFPETFCCRTDGSNIQRGVSGPYAGGTADVVIAA